MIAIFRTDVQWDCSFARKTAIMKRRMGQ